MRALWTAVTGMIAKQLDIDVIANNLANVNTPGFKKSRAEFQDLIYQTLRLPGSTQAEGLLVPTGSQVGLGTRTSAISKLFSQGDFVQTGNLLDLAIEGEGFFQVQLPDGTTAYTRDGSFKLDAEGRIVTSDGYPLQPPITIPREATHIAIGADGTVTVNLPGQAVPQQAGRIELARFANPEGLSSIGRNLFTTTAASGDAAVGAPGAEGFGTLAQGFLEMSNVKVVEEMVRMIIAQRAYEATSKAVSTADEMWGMANNLKR